MFWFAQRKEGGSDFLAVGIGQTGVRDDQINFFQCFAASFHFPGFPKVVLVGEEDDVATRRAQRVLKVADIAVLALVMQNPHTRIVECLNHFKRSVGRTIIRNDDFVVRRELRNDAFQLRRNEGLSVIGGNAN